MTAETLEIIRTALQAIATVCAVVPLIVAKRSYEKTINKEGDADSKLSLRGKIMRYIKVTGWSGSNIIIAFLAGVAVTSFIASFWIPSQETCETISPYITLPVDREEIDSPFTVRGSVEAFPNQSFLWMTVFNQNMRQYTDIVPIIPDKGEWDSDIHLTGGKGGDAYSIEISLADKEMNRNLEKIQRKITSELPSGEGIMHACREVNVKWKN